MLSKRLLRESEAQHGKQPKNEEKTLAAPNEYNSWVESIA